MDVRAVRPGEAWVAVQVDGRQIVVGLRREPSAAGDPGATPDGWFRLLYLYEAAAADATRACPTRWAATIVFLASDDGSFVTGSELYVDGGYMAR